MVRQVVVRFARSWKPVLAIAVAGGAVLWHVLACTESPMSFSPDGRQLAFTTMEPYEAEHNLAAAGPRLYRLMVLSEGKELQVIEETTDFMLSGPGFSPDGKRLAYLRIPLLTAKGVEKLQEHAQAREKAFGGDPFAWADLSASPPSRPATEPASSQPSAETLDLSAPPVDAVVALAQRLIANIEVPAELVVRDAKSRQIVSTTPVELRLTPELDPDLLITYATLRPQWSPDGQWVYLCAAEIAWAVNPSANERRAYGIAGNIALSPDGQTLALGLGQAVGLIRTDGQTAVYRRLEQPVSRSGMTWLGKDKLAALTFTKEGDPRARLYVIGADGAVIENRPLPIADDAGSEENTGALAVAPDGGSMVVAYGEHVYFLDAKGTVAKHWQAQEGEILAQPAFSPDSKTVAFKYMKEREGSHPRAEAIAFFSPRGEELKRVPIPKIAPTATRPVGESTEPK